MPPKTIGIIMDGNRRWARAQGLPSVAGHSAGFDKLKEVVGWCKDSKVQNLIVYAFSTENWNREASEVSYLMDLILHAVESYARELKKEGIRIRIAGERERFSPKIQEAMMQAEEHVGEAEHTLWLALSYGGRAEILQATNKLISEGVHKVSEADFVRALWTNEMPDPELIIRTGGETRLSGFLPWQSVYSELFFIPTLWPDFARADFDAILSQFESRERRLGK